MCPRAGGVFWHRFMLTCVFMLMHRWAFKGRYQRRMHFLLYKHFVGCNAGIVTSLLNAESVDLHYTKCVPARYTTPRHSARHGTASLRVSPRGCFAEGGEEKRSWGGKCYYGNEVSCVGYADANCRVSCHHHAAATVSTMLTTHCYSDDVCVETTTT